MKMKYGNDYENIPKLNGRNFDPVSLRPDVYVYSDGIVNLVFIGKLGADGYVIVDTGMPSQAQDIIQTARDLYGQTSKPKQIILTHGHFDHVGNVIELVEEFEVPVYVHHKEMPYVTGEKAYVLDEKENNEATLNEESYTIPVDPIDLGEHVHALPPHGKVPGLKEFQWIHTPGHSPGQIALFRARDRLLIGGDAFVTTDQNHLYSEYTDESETIGLPPAAFVQDWKAAKKSVQKLQELKPEFVILGHGAPMRGKTLSENLEKLVNGWHREDNTIEVEQESAHERKIAENLSVPNEQDIVAPLFEESLEAENPKRIIE